jgi:magnesium chelatase subunit I
MTTHPAISQTRPRTLQDLRESGWTSKSLKQEIHDNFVCALAGGEELFPGIIGFEDTVVPEINNAIIAKHDMLFLGEKGQAKSRLMRMISRFLDAAIPYLDLPTCPVHEDPQHPITKAGRALLASGEPAEIPIAWWPREERYAERLAPGTKFADIIGEIDPAKLAGGESLSAEEALHFGLIPRMHRGIFAMNELPDLDELVQVGLFNILEERDVQIRGYPIRFDVDVLILFSANPTTYNRSGKVIPQLKDRIGSTIQTHYPRERVTGIEIMKQEASVDLDDRYPVVVPPFMDEIVEEISICARKSKYVDHQSGVSARFSIANYRTMIASARQRSIRLGEKPAVPRISDLGHLYASAGDQGGLRGVRGLPRPRRDRRHLRQGGQDRGRRHAPLGGLRGASQTRAAGVGKGLRGQPRRLCPGAGVVRGVRPGGPLRHRSRLALTTSRQDHL